MEGLPERTRLDLAAATNWARMGLEPNHITNGSPSSRTAIGRAAPVIIRPLCPLIIWFASGFSVKSAALWRPTPAAILAVRA